MWQRYRSRALRDESNSSWHLETREPSGVIANLASELRQTLTKRVVGREAILCSTVGDRNETIDALRGLAALAVCLYHTTLLTPFAHGTWASLFHWGYAGVTCFFVISGFIVPYAMHTAGYSLGSAHRFLAKRLVRLDPPYLASIVLMLLIWYVATTAPGFRGQPMSTFVSYSDLPCHLVYLCGFIGQPWVSGVYWTLAIEFQFYLLLALIFPLITLPIRNMGLMFVGGLTAIGMGTGEDDGILIFAYLPIFAAGLLTFLAKIDAVPRGSYWPCLAIIGLVIIYRIGPVPALVAVGTAAAIYGNSIPRLRFLAFLGAISYSLYLVHSPIVLRVTNLFSRLDLPASMEALGIAVALASAIVAAYWFNRVVERPAITLSQKISMRPTISKKRSQEQGHTGPLRGRTSAC